MDWHGIPSLSALRAFEAAARLGSLSAAAKELNVTHAAVAQHVRTLEDFFGVPLLIRAGRGMASTPDGLALSEGLATGFGTIAAAVSDLAQHGKDRPVVISTTRTFAAGWLMPRLADFWMDHPDIEIDIRMSHDSADLRTDGVDIALRYGVGPWPGLESMFLIEAGYTAVARAGLVPEGTGLSDVTDLPLLAFGPRLQIEMTWLEAHGLDPASDGVRRFETAQLVLEAAKAGLGVAIVPSVVSEPLIEDGTLDLIARDADRGPGYHIVTRPTVVNPKRDKVVRWLKRQVA